MTDERTADRDNAYAKTIRENRELREKLIAAEAEKDSVLATLAKMTRQAEAAEADRDRLREALRNIRDPVFAYYRPTQPELERELDRVQEVARAALAAPDTPPDA